MVPHNDVAAVSTALAGAGGRRAMVLAESIYSVLGDAAPLLELAGVCAAYDALLVVDEAHGLGRGRRRRPRAGRRPRPGRAGARGRDRDALQGARRPGRCGARLARRRRAPGQPRPPVHLRHRPRPRVPRPVRWPRSTCSARNRRCRPWSRSGWPPSPARWASTVPSGAVLSVPMPSPQVALAAQAAALDEGVRVGCFRPPSVPDGISRLRITTNAGLAEADWAARRRRARPGGQGVRRPVSILVVTGTSTGVGKTIVTAALAVRAAAAGSVVVVKPVQTGVGPDSDEVADADVVHALTGCAVQEFTCLPDPLAPDTAARLRGVRIPPVAEYADRIRVLAEFHDTVIVEGAGGLLVRLDTEGGTLLDLAVAVGGRGGGRGRRRARHAQPRRADRRRPPGPRDRALGPGHRVLARRARARGDLQPRRPAARDRRTPPREGAGRGRRAATATSSGARSPAWFSRTAG